MANTFTTNYALTKPEVGSANDQWGTLVNSNFDTIDSEIYTKQDKADAKGVTHASLSFSGNNITTTNTLGFKNFVAGDRIFISNLSTNLQNNGEFLIENVVSDTVLDLKKADGTTDAGFQTQTISSNISLVPVPKFTRQGLTQLTGEIRLFGSTSSSVINNLGSVPYGGATRYYWLLCNGQAVSKTVYDQLYEVLKNGTGSCVFGESGGNFNLPDLRGRVPVGDNVMGGSSASRMPSNADNIGESGGAHEHTLTKEQSGLPAHGHAHNITADQAQHRHDMGNHTHESFQDGYSNNSTGYSDQLPYILNKGGSYSFQTGTPSDNNTSYTDPAITISGSVTNHSGANASQAHSILQPYLIVGSYIIAT